jgi:hypothetical protein
MEAIGRRRWAIAEGYIPSESAFSDRALISHETACILNASDREARIEITILFADREPVGPYKVTVGARRTLHLRFNDLEDPAGAARHRLRLDIRVRRSDHRAAHEARLAPRRARAALHDGLFGELKDTRSSSASRGTFRSAAAFPTGLTLPPFRSPNS